MKAIFLSLVLGVCLGQSVSAVADDLYDNGPSNSNTYAWTINFGYEVSNNLNLSNCQGYPWNPVCTVNGVMFLAWLYPGDALQSVEVSITSDEFGGTTYFDQVVNFSQGSCLLGNDYGYNVCQETGNFPSFTLANGSYWLNLQNALVSNGDPVYWDENDGPSLASENTIGTLPSESFTLLGTSTTWCWWCGTTPEPGSSVLFGSGAVTIFAFLGLLRRKLF